MPIKPDDFYLSSQKGFSSTSEIDRRNAVSRTYYAMYHHVLNTGIEVTPYAGQGVHQCLIDTMRARSDSKQRRASYILENAKKMRHLADYDLHAIFTESEAVTVEKSYQNIQTLM